MKIRIGHLVCILGTLFCSRNPVAQINVDIPPDYRGEVAVALCVSGKPGVALLGQNGQGDTSTCPNKGTQVSVFDVHGGAHTEIAAERIRFDTTGDGYLQRIIISPHR